MFDGIALRWVKQEATSDLISSSCPNPRLGPGWSWPLEVVGTTNCCSLLITTNDSTMTTSFDTPRVFGHHNPFASFSDTTDDPLASSSAGVGVSAGFGTSAGNSSADPWSSYYNPPVASTSSSNQPNGSSSSSSLSNVIDEETIPHVYTQAWHAASSSSTTTGPASFGSTFNNANTISLVMLQRVLSTAAGLGAGETEKVSLTVYASLHLAMN